MYELMLEQRPDNCGALWLRAVTAEGMRGDSVAQIMLPAPGVGRQGAHRLAIRLGWSKRVLRWGKPTFWSNS